MRNRLRHRLRQLWAEGKLVVGGKVPPWMKALPAVEEATPEEVQAVLIQTENTPAGSVHSNYVVVEDTGRIYWTSSGSIPSFGKSAHVLAEADTREDIRAKYDELTQGR